jgi:hypothetical protein
MVRIDPRPALGSTQRQAPSLTPGRTSRVKSIVPRLSSAVTRRTKLPCALSTVQRPFDRREIRRAKLGAQEGMCEGSEAKRKSTSGSLLSSSDSVTVSDKDLSARDILSSFNRLRAAPVPDRRLASHWRILLLCGQVRRRSRRRADWELRDRVHGRRPVARPISLRGSLLRLPPRP